MRQYCGGQAARAAATTLLSGQWETSQRSALSTDELISLQADTQAPLCDAAGQFRAPAGTLLPGREAHKPN